MSGRHRKPTKNGLRLAQAGALSLMAAAPLGLAGSAMAATPTAMDRHQDKADSTRLASDESDDNDHYSRDDSDGDNGSDGDSDSEGSSDASSASFHNNGDDEPERWSYQTHGHASERESAADKAKAAARKARAAEDFAHPAGRSIGRAATLRSSSGSGATSTANKTAWDRLARCESTNNWAANTGNGFKGGLQFTDSTWRSFGGHSFARSADKASREEQIEVAKKVQAAQGWKAWPSCSRKLGYS